MTEIQNSKHILGILHVDQNLIYTFIRGKGFYR